MQYVLLFLAVAIAIFFLARWFIHASPNQVKRLLLFIAILVLILLSIALFKFGGLFVAALAVLIPIARRLMAAYATYRYFKKMRDKGQQQDSHTRQHPHPATNLSEKEAREILGISENATKEEIKEAYHKLMQKNHPDQGGSEYFAKKLNQAKDTLLGK